MTETPRAHVTIVRRVEWMDTDAAGIYHWTTVFRFAEAAEAALHDGLGIAELTFGATPRVAVSAEFERPLRFNHRVEVELAVESVGRTSMRYAVVITAAAGVAATASITVCLIDRATREATPWPDDVRRALETGGAVQPP
jgi:YbgC/YbaW family acyl-CoA thioester hydrolase